MLEGTYRLWSSKRCHPDELRQHEPHIGVIVRCPQTFISFYFIYILHTDPVRIGTVSWVMARLSISVWYLSSFDFFSRFKLLTPNQL